MRGGRRANKEPLKPGAHVSATSPFGVPGPRRERERDDAQGSRSLPSPNDSGACDSNPGPQSFCPKSVLLPRRQGTGVPKCDLAHSQPGAAARRLAASLQLSPTRGVRVRWRRKRRGAPVFGARSLPLGSACVGGDRRVERGRRAGLPCGVGGPVSEFVLQLQQGRRP